MTITNRLTYIYIMALVAIAVLCMFAYGILLHLISLERTSGALINLSGRQRMLTQTTPALSTKLIKAAEAERPALRARLNEIADTLDSNHQLLIHGDPDNKLPPYPESVQALFFSESYQLDRKLKTFTTAIRALTAEPAANLTFNNPHLQLIETAALGELYTLNNQVVSEYQRVSEKQIDFVRLANSMILFVIILTLLLEGRYIFRPMIKRIEDDKHRLELLNEELASLSAIDGLTAIANRRHFDTVLDQEWDRLKREQEPLALAMIDIDYFKFYNDTYGHQAGDACLIQIAKAIKTTLNRPGV